MKILAIMAAEIALYFLLELALIAWHPFMWRHVLYQDANTTRSFEFDWIILLFTLNCVFCAISALLKSKRAIYTSLGVFVVALWFGGFVLHLGPITIP